MVVKAIIPDHSSPLKFPADFLADDLQDHFKDKSVQEHGPLWDQLWKQQRTSWDRGGPSLALHETLTAYPELFDGTYPDLGLLSDFVSHGTGQPSSYADAPATAPRKKALVPACGRGYDAVLLAKVFGYDVVGLEISSSALDAARQYLDGVDEVLHAHQTQQTHSAKDNPAMRFWVENQSTSSGSVRWVSGDFFSEDWLTDAGAEQFDLIFDYTVRLSHFLKTPPTPFCLCYPGHSLGSFASQSCPQGHVHFHSVDRFSVLLRNSALFPPAMGRTNAAIPRSAQWQTDLPGISHRQASLDRWPSPQRSLLVLSAASFQSWEQPGHHLRREEGYGIPGPWKT